MRKLLSMLLMTGLTMVVGCGGPDTAPEKPEQFAPPPGASGGSTTKEQKKAAQEKIGSAGELVP